MHWIGAMTRAEIPAERPSHATERADDGELLVRYRDGDGGAFAELVTRYRRPIYGYLVRCGIEEAARDDLFQEVFGAVHGAAAAYDAERPARSWIFAIAANAVRSHYRKRRVREVALPATDWRQRQDTAPDSQLLAEARETALWIERAIAALPLSQREVVVLCCIEQLPHSDVAAALGMPTNTVKTHLRRARITLAQALARRTAALRREVSS